MNSTHPLDDAIREAEHAVAREGWESADLRQITLAGFGYLAHRLSRSRVRPHVTMVGVSASGWIAALVLGVIEALRRF